MHKTITAAAIALGSCFGMPGVADTTTGEKRIEATMRIEFVLDGLFENDEPRRFGPGDEFSVTIPLSGQTAERVRPQRRSIQSDATTPHIVSGNLFLSDLAARQPSSVFLSVSSLDGGRETLFYDADLFSSDRLLDARFSLFARGEQLPASVPLSFSDFARRYNSDLAYLDFEVAAVDAAGFPLYTGIGAVTSFTMLGFDSVPEPSAIGLAGAAFVGICQLRVRRRVAAVSHSTP